MCGEFRVIEGVIVGPSEEDDVEHINVNVKNTRFGT